MKLSVQYFLATLVAIIGLSSCQQSETTTRYVIGDNVSYLLLGSDVEEEELQEIAAEFKSLQDIDIDFDGTLYNTDGKVVSLSFKVSTKNGAGEISNAPSAGSAGFIVDENNFRISNNLRLNI